MKGERSLRMPLGLFVLNWSERSTARTSRGGGVDFRRREVQGSAEGGVHVQGGQAGGGDGKVVEAGWDIPVDAFEVVANKIVLQHSKNEFVEPGVGGEARFFG